MKRQVSLFLVCILIVGLFTGCGEKKNGSTGGEELDQAEVDIGMCFDTFTIERWEKDRDIFTYNAQEMDQTVEVQNAYGDVNKQREQIQHFIDIGVKAIVVIAVDADQITDLLETAHKKGIYIIAYDRFIENCYLDLYITFDNEMVGEEMAQSMETQFEERSINGKKVLMLCGPNSDKNVAMVETGFRRVAEENNFTILDTYYVEAWRSENVEQYFTDHPDVLEDVDAIMCGNDSLAGAVIQILSEKQLAGQIIVTGQDADLDACQRIVEGTQTMTVYKPVEQMAKLAAEYTHALITEEKLPDTVTETIENGERSVPYVGLSPLSVDQENMDSVIIESGFHLEEDVYRNRPMVED